VELNLRVIFKIKFLVLRNSLLSQSLGVILIPILAKETILGKNMLVEVVLVHQHKRPRGNLESFLVPRTTPGAQPTIDAKWKKIEREVAWKCIARLLYDVDIPFNAATSVYYQPMLDAIASCGSGFKGPSYEDIRGHLLKNEVERVKEYLIEFKESWSKTECTIMSDGWTDQ
jgi:hypothetical protein